MTAVRLESVLEGHTAPVRCLTFSADGATIASAADDGTVRVWDVGRGTSQRLPTNHRGALTLVLSRRGRFLATDGPPDAPRFWDVESGRALRTIARPGAGLVGLAPLGDREGFGVAMEQRLFLWEAPNGEISPVAMERFAHDDLYYVEGVAFSSDGRVLATGSTSISWERGSETPFESVRVWELPGGKLRRTLPATAPMKTLRVSPSGQMLAALGSQDGPHELHVWSVATGESLVTLPVDAVRGWIRDMAFLPDDRHLVTAIVQSERQGANLLVMEPAGAHRRGEKMVLTLVSVLTGVTGIALSTNGARVGTVDSRADHTVRVWRMD